MALLVRQKKSCAETVWGGLVDDYVVYASRPSYA